MNRTIMLFIAFLMGAIFLSFLLSFPVMLLWNWALVPAVSVTSEISWLQAWGIMILFNMIVKSTVTIDKR